MELQKFFDEKLADVRRKARDSTLCHKSMRVEFASLFKKLFGMTTKDVLVDLGGGYGTFAITICKLVGCRGLSLEIDNDCVLQAKKLAKSICHEHSSQL